MTIQQLYLAIAVPIVVNILFNGTLLILFVYNALNQRISDLRADVTGRVDSLREDVKALTGKVIEVDNRLTRVETKLHIE
jgi:hypothetical protein